ncbi:MAG: hypothetical protein ACK4E5_10655 [Erythrobacter cryptus]
MQTTKVMKGRQFGLDWLRIGAFALLILSHIGMFFVPWGWHVKAAQPVEWAVWPMMAVNPWRLMLLFVISGVVSRALLAKLACAGMFAAQGLSEEAAAGDTTRALLRTVLGWSAILGLLGFAQTRLHHDGPVRRYLTEAIFPYYIIHQTIIVAAGFWLRQAGAGNELAFVVILLTTPFGCALTYEIARRISWLRPLLGLKRAAAYPRKTGKAPAPRSAGAGG